jgi:lipid-binding SYLF domain-containing protein
MKRLGLTATFFLVFFIRVNFATAEDCRQCTCRSVPVPRECEKCCPFATAQQIIQDLSSTPDRGIPLDIARKAQCVTIIPGFKKGAFLFGGDYSRGVATCRTSSGWSAPVIIRLTGASFGLQAGGTSADVILIGTNRRSLDALLKGGDISAPAGPVGRNSEAATAETGNDEFLAYSRSRGLFAGIDLTGNVIKQDQEATSAIYGPSYQASQILGGKIPPPGSAKPFLNAVDKYFQQTKRYE